MFNVSGGYVYDLALCPSMPRVAFAQNNQIQIRNISEQASSPKALERVLKSQGPNNKVVFHSNRSDILFSGGMSVRVWDLASSETCAILRIPTGAVTALEFFQGRLYVGTSGSIVQAYEFDLQEEAPSYKKAARYAKFIKGSVTAIGFNLGQVYVGYEGGSIHVFSLETKVLMKKISPGSNFTSAVDSILFANQTMVAGFETSGMETFDLTTFNVLQKWSVEPKYPVIKKLALDRDGIVYGADDNKIIVYDLKTLKVLATLNVHTKDITVFVLGNEPNGNVFVLSTSEDSTASYWYSNKLGKIFCRWCGIKF